jgi:hypothetical protein
MTITHDGLPRTSISHIRWFTSFALAKTMEQITIPFQKKLGLNDKGFSAHGIIRWMSMSMMLLLFSSRGVRQCMHLWLWGYFD